MTEYSNIEPGNAQWLAMFILALWIVLVVVLGLFLLTGRAAARTVRPDATCSRHACVLAATSAPSPQINERFVVL
jgi:hypothetical protein